MSDALIPPHLLFDAAQRYWNRLKEFVDNHEEVSDFLLQRVQAEYNVLYQERHVDFNELYKDRFTEFVLDSYALIMNKMHHAPSARCLFRIPEDPELLEEITKQTKITDALDKKWQFVGDDEIFITSLNDIIQHPGEARDWIKHVYVTEKHARRYTNTALDGKKYLLEKKIFECYYRKFDEFLIRLIARKHVPNGPFEYLFDIFQSGKRLTPQRETMKFPLEQSLDDHIERQKGVLEEHFGSKNNEQEKKDEA